MRHHTARWLILIAIVIVGAVVLGISEYLGSAAPPPLALPATAGAAAVGALNGTWEVGPGSVAGFRVQLTALGMHSDVSARTEAVSGMMVVADGQATAAAVRVDLTALKLTGRLQSQLAGSLDTLQHPVATLTLAKPAALTANAPIAARLALNGASRLVTFTSAWQRRGRVLEGVASIPVTFADWGIPQPVGLGWLGSIADHGVAEFLLIMQPSTAGSVRAGG